MFQLLDFAKLFIKDCIPQNGVVCDFTMGNGYDTEFLCSLVPNGKVFAFDIQKEAIDNTRARLNKSGFTNAELIHDSHACAEKYIHESIDAGMFNLGFRPGGDHSLYTIRDSTMHAVMSAIKLLKAGGNLVISVYPGHNEGQEEGLMLQNYLSTLDKKLFCTSHFHLLNSPDASYILAIEKYNKKENKI